MEKLFFVLLIATAIIPLLVAIQKQLGRVWPLSVGTLTLTAIALIWWKPGGDLVLETALPQKVEDGGFVGSEACRSCHPDQYSSWYASFHRTMTQAATPKTVLASFDQVRLEDRGEVYNLERRGDEFWVEMKALWQMETAEGRDLSRLPHLPRVQQRVFMTTGSHHFQAYWIRVPEFNGMFFQLPWFFHIADQRWIPDADTFLKPPVTLPERTVMWNESCLDCHTVGGAPQIRVGEGTISSQVAELGIACESCHGPGGEHVRVNRQPLRRYLYHFGEEQDPTIVNPAQLEPKRAADVCGQCHSVSGTYDPESWSLRGRSYRAGEELSQTRHIVRYSEGATDPWLQNWLRDEPDFLSGNFWKDGTIRVAGREFNGLMESECFRNGDITCLSCHSMHASDPRNQLAADMDGDSACLQCHTDYAERISEHTHHTPGSSGSSCYNCHMPNTTFGLFSAMRSHRIDNPSAANSLSSGRPNACNLCHLDQSLQWTATHLSQWYGQPPVEMSQADPDVAAGVSWLLRGDAVQRAVAASNIGWGPALEASGNSWQAPLLAQLLVDPYSAVRYVAYQSLRRLPGFDSFQYDFIAPLGDLSERRQAALDLWSEQTVARVSRRPELLMTPTGRLQLDRLLELLSQRDDRPVRIIE